MLKIQDFILRRDKSIETLNKELKEFIKNFTNIRELTILLNWISSQTKISKTSLVSDTEIFVFKQFINSKGKFNKVFDLKNILIDSLKYLLFFSYIRLSDGMPTTRRVPSALARFRILIWPICNRSKVPKVIILIYISLIILPCCLG